MSLLERIHTAGRASGQAYNDQGGWGVDAHPSAVAAYLLGSPINSWSFSSLGTDRKVADLLTRFGFGFLPGAERPTSTNIEWVNAALFRATTCDIHVMRTVMDVRAEVRKAIMDGTFHLINVSDPTTLMAWLQNAHNRESLLSHGLLTETEVQELQEILGNRGKAMSSKIMLTLLAAMQATAFARMPQGTETCTIDLQEWNGGAPLLSVQGELCDPGWPPEVTSDWFEKEYKEHPQWKINGETMVAFLLEHDCIACGRDSGRYVWHRHMSDADWQALLPALQVLQYSSHEEGTTSVTAADAAHILEGLKTSRVYEDYFAPNILRPIPLSPERIAQPYSSEPEATDINVGEPGKPRVQILHAPNNQGKSKTFLLLLKLLKRIGACLPPNVASGSVRYTPCRRIVHNVDIEPVAEHRKRDGGLFAFAAREYRIWIYGDQSSEAGTEEPTFVFSDEVGNGLESKNAIAWLLFTVLRIELGREPVSAVMISQLHEVIERIDCEFPLVALAGIAAERGLPAEAGGRSHRVARTVATQHDHRAESVLEVLRQLQFPPQDLVLYQLIEQLIRTPLRDGQGNENPAWRTIVGQIESWGTGKTYWGKTPPLEELRR